VPWVRRVIRRPVIAEDRVQFQIHSCEVCGWQRGTGRGFSPSTPVFLCQHYSAKAPCKLSSACWCYRKNECAKRGNPPNMQESGGFWRKMLSLSVWKGWIGFECTTRSQLRLLGCYAVLSGRKLPIVVGMCRLRMHVFVESETARSSERTAWRQIPEDAVFRHIRKIAKRNYWLRHGTSRLTQDGFWWNVILSFF
jgi:hypothetical protein